MRKLCTYMLAFTAFAIIAIVVAESVNAAETVKVGWSRYTGFEPLGLMQNTGIMEKWNKKMGTDVQLEFVGNYVDSVTLYSSGQYQGVAVTNMDVLAIAGVGGRHSTAVIVGDYSNGNDGLVLKGFSSLAKVKSNINLVEYSVSHYLLARCAEKMGVDINSFTLENTMDSDIPAVVEANDAIAVVAWNPMLTSIKELNDANIVCTSSEFPGEIIDMVVVSDDVDENSRKALTGAWYEAMALIKSGDVDTLSFLAEQSGSTLEDFMSQLKTTHLFYTANDAVSFIKDAELKATMTKVVKFSFEAGVYDGVDDPNEIGVKFADGSVMGDEANVMLTFDPSVTQWVSTAK